MTMRKVMLILCAYCLVMGSSVAAGQRKISDKERAGGDLRARE
jgi:hypothetical protein